MGQKMITGTISSYSMEYSFWIQISLAKNKDAQEPAHTSEIPASFPKARMLHIEFRRVQRPMGSQRLFDERQKEQRQRCFKVACPMTSGTVRWNLDARERETDLDDSRWVRFNYELKDTKPTAKSKHSSLREPLGSQPRLRHSKMTENTRIHTLITNK